MKALASSDLCSYIELARQFLNIGKPFQIEGIGTLVRNKSGELEFTPDHLLVGKMKDGGIKELSATSTSDESITTYESLNPMWIRALLIKEFLSFCWSLQQRLLLFGQGIECTRITQQKSLRRSSRRKIKLCR